MSFFWKTNVSIVTLYFLVPWGVISCLFSLCKLFFFQFYHFMAQYHLPRMSPSLKIFSNIHTPLCVFTACVTLNSSCPLKFWPIRKHYYQNKKRFHPMRTLNFITMEKSKQRKRSTGQVCIKPCLNETQKDLTLGIIARWTITMIYLSPQCILWIMI